MTARVLSMRTSLDASTVTPGRTAPDVSLTTPAMVLCARAAAGSIEIPSTTQIAAAIPLLVMPLPPNGQLLDPDEERGAEGRTQKCRRLLTPQGWHSQGRTLRRYASLRLRISSASGPGVTRRSAASAISTARSNRPDAAYAD